MPPTQPFKCIVESQYNLIVMPDGPDPETVDELLELEKACQVRANQIAKPVVLTLHAGRRTEYQPKKK